MLHYDNEHEGVPDAEHILVAPLRDQADLDLYLTGRIYEPLFLYDMQGLEVYKVYAKPDPTQNIPIPPALKNKNLLGIQLP